MEVLDICWSPIWCSVCPRSTLLEREEGSLLPIAVRHQGIQDSKLPLKTCSGSKSLIQGGGFMVLARVRPLLVSSSEGPMTSLLVSWDLLLKATELVEASLELTVALQATHFPSWVPCSLHKDGTSREWSISCGERKDAGRHTWSPQGSDFPRVAWTGSGKPALPHLAKQRGIGEKLPSLLGDGGNTGWEIPSCFL